MQYPGRKMNMKGKKAVEGIGLLTKILLGILLLISAIYVYILFKDSGANIISSLWK